ncbi:uncharacterized protein LOC136086423 [Hydra vulgaris]|uniref:Uncharacterized protein LOC136086423 n=1 Tax=Hydra vulgaris TaxID=6087 RepID=A0ABM4CSC3_HYDVU
MALGIYLNFFNFFEDEVHELDVLLAAEAIKMTNNYTANYNEEYQVFIKEQKELSNLQCEIVCLNEKLQSINDMALLAAIQNSDYGMNAQSLYNSDIDSINFKKGKKTNQYNTLMQKHSLKKGQGPCTRQIEAVLQKLNVQRQAYHGKSFIGNHVQKMLKPNFEHFNIFCQKIEKSRHAVQNAYKKHLESNTFTDKPRCGLPRMSTLRQDRTLKRLALTNCRLSSKILSPQWHDVGGPLISPKSVRRRLNKQGLNGRVSIKKPFISKINQQKRLKFGHEFLHFSVTDW